MAPFPYQQLALVPPALLYVSALFHDLGLTSHGISHEATQLVWDAIVLHTSWVASQYKEPVVALLYRGVVFDVIGDHFADLSEETRTQVVSAFPREDFKQKILQTFLDGFGHKPEATYGTINADI
jgi:hypothetical protein